MATSTIVLREAALDPQQLYLVTTKSPAVTNAAGEVTSWNYHTYLGMLHVKQLIIEVRGYNSGNYPKKGPSSSTKAWRITQNGNIVAEGTFEEKSVSYESFRSNEAGMFRVRKTVTIKALYENGVFALGKTQFDTADYSL